MENSHALKQFFWKRNSSRLNSRFLLSLRISWRMPHIGRPYAGSWNSSAAFRIEIFMPRQFGHVQGLRQSHLVKRALAVCARGKRLRGRPRQIPMTYYTTRTVRSKEWSHRELFKGHVAGNESQDRWEGASTSEFTAGNADMQTKLKQDRKPVSGGRIDRTGREGQAVERYARFWPAKTGNVKKSELKPNVFRICLPDFCFYRSPLKYWV